MKGLAPFVNTNLNRILYSYLVYLPIGYFQNSVKLISLSNPITQLLILLEPFSMQLHGINHVFWLCQLI